MPRSRPSVPWIAAFVVAQAVAALPAAARDAVNFSGTMTVCAEPPSSPKPQAAECPASNPHGLWAVSQAGGAVGPGGIRTDPSDRTKWTDRYGDYQIVSSSCRLDNPQDSDATAAGKPCDLSLAGHVGPNEAGVGAACTVMEGSDGAGTLSTDNGSVYHLSNVTWQLEGSTAAVQGEWQQVAVGSGKKPGPLSGVLTGELHVSTGEACVKGAITGESGQTTFGVEGFLQLI